MNSFRCLLLLIGIQTASAAEFKIGSHTFTLPEGFTVEMIAGPGLVDRPIVADFDPQGRLYLADSSGSNDRTEKQLQERPHRIVRLEDSDGDGRFDKSVVFADKMMFPEGIMFLNGSVYCGAPPSIWKLTDKNDDGIADERTEWYKGEVLGGCANDVHGPYFGIDGWVYWTKGAFAKLNLQRPGQKPITDSAAHIFRARPDGTELESVISGGMDNPVDVTFTPAGDAIFTTTFYSHPRAGQRDCLVHAIYGGVYPKTHGVLDGLVRTGDLLPALTHLGPAAPSGLCTYRSSTFGKAFRHNLFSALFNLRKVQRHILSPSGATFSSKDEDFLVSDNHDFHPTDVFEDADGSLIVIDTGGWYKLCCPTSQLAKPDVLGAIYRVRKSNALPVKDPRGKTIPWQTAKSQDLIKLLDDARPAVVDAAIAELSSRNAVAELAQSFKTIHSSDARLNAVWTLNRMNSPVAREVIRKALLDSDPLVQQAAIHSAGLWRDREADLLPLLAAKSPTLRREAATSLGRLGKASAVEPLLNACALSDDPVLDHSLIYALIELNSPEKTAAGLKSKNPRTVKAALIALDQMDTKTLTANQMVGYLQSTNEPLRQAALFLVASRPAFGKELVPVFRTWLLESKQKNEDEFSDQLAQLTKSPDIQSLLAEVLRNDTAPLAARKVSLQAMRKSQDRTPKEEWIQAVYQTLQPGNKDLIREAVVTARALALPKTNTVDLNERLLSLATDSSLGAEVRLNILNAHSGKLALNDELFAFVVSQLKPENPPLLRSAAAGVLAKASLTQDQLHKLSEAAKTASAIEFSKLFPAFHRVDESNADEVFKNIREAKSLKALRVEQVKPLVAKLKKSQAEGNELLKMLNVNFEEQQKRLVHLDASLQSGDIRKGQALFNSSKAVCATCHTVGYVGGQIGPDLTKIGSIRTQRDLIEAIVFPSASFARGYETVVIKVKDGEEFSGMIRNETSDSITLATGPGMEQQFAKTDIAETRPGAVSIMPEGLDQQLSTEDLSNLLAFLKALK